VSQFLPGNGIFATDYPLCSSDLAPPNFWLFPNPKNVLKGKYFCDNVNIKSSVERFLTSILVQDVSNCIEQWLKRGQRCKELEGDCFENSRLLISAALKTNFKRNMKLKILKLFCPALY
jgi:hypothetical protein